MMTSESTAEALTGLSCPRADVHWTTLVERHGPDIWRLIASRNLSSHDAEDAYQDFWLRLPRAAMSFRPPTGDDERSARAWLMRVAYTAAIDHGRRRRSHRPAPTAAPGRSTDMEDRVRAAGSGPLAEHLTAQPPAGRPDTEEISDRRLLMDRVQVAIGTLPESYRRPLLLHLVAGLSYDDLATDLRCTVNHARVKVHRGLKRLRVLLGVDDQRLPDRTLAGMIVPLLAMPSPPPLPPPAAFAAAAAPHPLAHSLAVGLKVVTFLASATAIAVVMVVAAKAAHPAAPPAAPVPQAARESTEIVLDDYSRPQTGMVGHGHMDKLPLLSLVTAPAGGGHGQALRIDWPQDHQRWVDATCEPRRSPIAGLTAASSGVVSAAVWSDGGGDVEHLGLRFIDASGEIFEYRRPLPELHSAGWQTVTFPLSLLIPVQFEHRPDKRGAIHYPLAFWGYGIQLSTATPKHAGTLIIDDVVLTLQR